MYLIIKTENHNNKEIKDLDACGINFGQKNKIYKIKGEAITNLIIYDKVLAHNQVRHQVEKKYNKLMMILPDLLVSDDDGESLREALNQIEKFRQIIKNKYRSYLKRQELEAMSKNLSVLQKTAQTRFIEIQNSKIKETYKRSSCK